MQILMGSIFANIMRVKKLTLNELKYVGRSTAAWTLYYGGLAFVVIGLFTIVFPTISNIALDTGIPIPNLDSIGIALVLVIVVVGIIGLGSMYKAYKEIQNYSETKTTPETKGIVD